MLQVLNTLSRWERKLSVSDIALIIEFIKTHAVNLYDEIKSYDQVAVQVLLHGFIAYGWTRREIRETKSSLFEELQCYVNLEDECLDTARQENLAIASLSTPVSEISQYTMSQGDLASPVLANLDSLLDEGSHMIATPTDSQKVPEPVIINQDFGFTEIIDLQIDHILSEADYDTALNTMQACDSEAQDDFNLFQKLFPELIGHEHWTA